jgi:hypothetical protein
MLAGNYTRSVDLTHPKLIQMMGGREKAIAIFKGAVESIGAETGMEPISSKAGTPLGFWNGGSDQFALVPVMESARFRGGKLTWKSYYVGISSDQGKTWTFVTGVGFQGEKAKRLKEWFPNWPSDLAIPVQEKPTFEAGQGH